MKSNDIPPPSIR